MRLFLLLRGYVMRFLLLLGYVIIAFQYNRLSELKTYELEISEVLMVSQQLA